MEFESRASRNGCDPSFSLPGFSLKVSRYFKQSATSQVSSLVLSGRMPPLPSLGWCQQLCVPELWQSWCKSYSLQSEHMAVLAMSQNMFYVSQDILWETSTPEPLVFSHRSCGSWFCYNNFKAIHVHIEKHSHVYGPCNNYEENIYRTNRSVMDTCIWKMICKSVLSTNQFFFFSGKITPSMQYRLSQELSRSYISQTVPFQSLRILGDLKSPVHTQVQVMRPWIQRLHVFTKQTAWRHRLSHLRI